MLWDIGGLLLYPTTPSVFPTSQVRIVQILMPCLELNGLRQLTFSSQSVHAVCEGVQAPHGKIETLCHGAQAVGVLSQDNMPPSMTSLEWSQAQLKDPANCQIIQAIQNKSLDTIKIKQDMSSDLKAFLRIRKQFKLTQGILYRKSQVNNNDTGRLQLVLPYSYRQKAMAGCHDQIGHLGQDRVLELLRDRFFWPGMQMDVASYINSCPRCIRRKSQPDTVPPYIT